MKMKMRAIVAAAAVTVLAGGYAAGRSAEADCQREPVTGLKARFVSVSEFQQAWPRRPEALTHWEHENKGRAGCAYTRDSGSNGLIVVCFPENR